jgi:FMN reductase
MPTVDGTPVTVEQPAAAAQIAVVVGNPKARSRTLGVALAVADVLAQAMAGPTERLVVDLAEEGALLFDQSSQRLSDLGAEVAASRVIVVASPTFKATYTGLLKAFFDRYGYRPLAGCVAVPVMTGAGSGHALAVEVHLRPLLVELGASVPTRGLYVTEAELPDLGVVVDAWAVDAVAQVRRALG